MLIHVVVFINKQFDKYGGEGWELVKLEPKRNGGYMAFFFGWIQLTVGYVAFFKKSDNI